MSFYLEVKKYIAIETMITTSTLMIELISPFGNRRRPGLIGLIVADCDCRLATTGCSF